MTTLTVLVASDSFAELWAQLGAALGARVDIHRAPASLPAQPTPCVMVVAAGGVEESAAPLVAGARGRARQIAVVGGIPDHRLAARLIHAGADEYFALPADLCSLRAWLRTRLQAESTALRAQTVAEYERSHYDFSRILGRSPELRRALEIGSRLIPRDATTVLLTGETGTGKELLANAIHHNGPRATRPFVEVNCAALPANLLEAELFGYERGAFTDARVAKPGLLEVAHRGTLFLDEIGDLAMAVQGKLLKVLEEKRIRRLGATREIAVDVRIIAATHVDLAGAVRAGVFREDLYYRLNVVPIRLPALRERGDDVLLIAEHFVARFCAELGFPPMSLSPEIAMALRAHPWRGNIRELRNAIERAVLLGDGALHPRDLFLATHDVGVVDVQAIPFPATADAILRSAAHAMVRHHDGNKSAAAAALGIGRKRLYALLDDAQRSGQLEMPRHARAPQRAGGTPC